MPISIRAAGPHDASVVAGFINELAAYEKYADSCHPDIWMLAGQLKESANLRLFCFIANDGNEDVGFALAYPVYSTFRTRWNLHLEDFFVKEHARGTGVGRLLFARICRVAYEHGCMQVDLEVLKWNEPSIAVYRKWGGEWDDEWARMRFDQETIEKFAEVPE